MEEFARAARLAAARDLAAARAAFGMPREADARDWFVEHAQISSHHRRRVLQVPRPAEPTKVRRTSTPLSVRERV